MEFLKFYKKEVVVSLFSASVVLMCLNHLYSSPVKKKFVFKKKHEKSSFIDKISQFFKPLFYFKRYRKTYEEIKEEKANNKLGIIMKFQQNEENEGKEIQDMVEIFDKTEETLEKIDYKALNARSKFKGKKHKKVGKKKRKAEYMHLRDQRNMLKAIVEDLYSFNKTQNEKKNISKLEIDN